MERYFIVMYTNGSGLFGEIGITTKGTFINRAETIRKIQDISNEEMIRITNIMELNSRKDAREWSRVGDEYSIN